MSTWYFSNLHSNPTAPYVSELLCALFLSLFPANVFTVRSALQRALVCWEITLPVINQICYLAPPSQQDCVFLSIVTDAFIVFAKFYSPCQPACEPLPIALPRNAMRWDDRIYHRQLAFKRHTLITLKVSRLFSCMWALSYECVDCIILQR